MKNWTEKLQELLDIIDGDGIHSIEVRGNEISIKVTPVEYSYIEKDMDDWLSRSMSSSTIVTENCLQPGFMFIMMRGFKIKVIQG